MGLYWVRDLGILPYTYRCTVLLAKVMKPCGIKHFNEEIVVPFH